MPVPTTHRLTVAEYHRLAETGALKPDSRVELLNGEILEMSPVGPFHGSVTKYLNQLFTRASRGRWITQVQDPVHLDEHSAPEPDLALLRPVADFYRLRHPQPADVYLVVEVSDTTLELDQGEKLVAYARTGIPEVWIVNLRDLVVQVYREPHFTHYGSNALFRPGQRVSPAGFPDVEVDVGQMLGR